jgi:hypothetical protein
VAEASTSSRGKISVKGGDARQASLDVIRMRSSSLAPPLHGRQYSARWEKSIQKGAVTQQEDERGVPPSDMISEAALALFEKLQSPFKLWSFAPDTSHG